MREFDDNEAFYAFQKLKNSEHNPLNHWKSGARGQFDQDTARIEQLEAWCAAMAEALDEISESVHTSAPKEIGKPTYEALIARDALKTYNSEKAKAGEDKK